MIPSPDIESETFLFVLDPTSYSPAIAKQESRGFSSDFFSFVENTVCGSSFRGERFKISPIDVSSCPITAGRL